MHVAARCLPSLLAPFVVSRCLPRCLPSASAFGFGFESHRPIVALDAGSSLPRRPPTWRTACETRTSFIRMTNQISWLAVRRSEPASMSVDAGDLRLAGWSCATHARGERMKRTRIVGRDSVPSVIRSLRTEATRAPEVFGSSRLQRSALRLDLFSLSCPRLEVRPDRRLAIVDPVRSTCPLAAPGYMQGMHHLAQRHAWRASAIGRRGTRGAGGTECFRVETRRRENRFGNAQQ